MRWFVTLVLLIISGGTNKLFTSAAQCNNAFPQFEFPDALEQVRGSLAFWNKKDNEYFRDYRVKSGTNEFTINCTSTYPVQFRVTLTKAYTNAIFNLYSEPTETTLNGRTKKEHCFKASITFLEVNENLSGLYACESFVTHNGNLAIFPELRPLGIFIYGTDGGSQNGTMLNRGKNITVKSEEDRGLLNSKFSLSLPCTFNTPSILETEISFRNAGEDRAFDVETTLCSDNRNLCVDFESFPSDLNAAAVFQHGARLSCVSNSSIDDLDSVVLNILPTSDFKYDPVEREMNLEVQEDEVYTFFCQSSKPLKLSTNYQREHQLSTNSLSLAKDPYYQAKLELVIPDGNDFPEVPWYWYYDYSDRSWRERKDINLTVTCSEDAMNNSMAHTFTWTYTLIFTLRFSDDDLAKSPLEYTNIVIVEHPIQMIMCRSASPDTMKVYFVPCSTITECQMKAPLLSDDDYNEDEYVTRFRHSVRLRLEPGISGMVRCVGFQKDMMSYFYIGIEDDIRRHYILSSILNIEPAVNPLVVLNTTEILVGETVEANCTSPLMTLMSTSIFEFRFRNGTFGFIYEDYISEQNSVTENELNTIYATIIIPSTEVIGISCANLQFEKVSPLVWKDGIMQKNGEDYALSLKSQTFTINVTARVEIPDPEILPGDKNGIYVGIAFGILFLIGVYTTVYFFLRFRAQKKFLDKLSDEEIELFRNGCPEFISENENANSNAQHLPFQPKYEIDPTNLEINYKEQLGVGEFGIVFKGILKLNEVVTVAVKSLKPGAAGYHLRSALSELKVMLFIGYHENIVQILGACTNELENSKLHVVMEFCENKSLLCHLRENSRFFFNQVQKGVYYHDLQDDGNYACFVKTSDLIKWAFQIANGMKYISGLKIIHGDLATRNILLDKNFTAKISDFGLSRKLYELPAYIRNKSVPLPWRWCALESLVQQEFSLATDVWSFGITLWEIFSLGESPYPGMEYDKQFIAMLTNNFRMAMPEYSSCEIYNIMMECWNKEPSKRPKFGELRERLEEMNCKTIETVMITEKSEGDQSQLPEFTDLKIHISHNGHKSPTTTSQYSKLSHPT